MKIVFFGDSITEGCFELYDNHKGSIDVIRDVESGYVTVVTERLRKRFPETEIEMINAGVGGESSGDALMRIEKDVIEKNPDITVVCLGLNDVQRRNADEYKKNISEIFTRLKDAGIDTVFMTPNMVNSYVHHLNLPILSKTAKCCAECQNDGTMDLYMEIACKCAEQSGVAVCNVYAIWKKMADYGVDTTELLCNYINHPIRPMHRLFADALEPYLVSKIKEKQ